jgi:membrane protease YdiL (CAAX protease family)
MASESDDLQPPAREPIAAMWVSALFWSMAALSVFPWIITQVSLWHESLDPAGAEAVWSAWWYNDHPMSQIVWGACMLACGAGLWWWLGRTGVRENAARRGDLGALTLLLIAAAVAINWIAFTPVEYVTLAVTGQEELPVEKPGWETTYAPSTLPGELFSSVIAAPVFEELAFRGFLLSVLLARGWSSTWAILVVAAAFASTHEQYYLSGQVSVFILGALMGFLRVASGGIAAPILAHGISNLLVTLYNFSIT